MVAILFVLACVGVCGILLRAIETDDVQSDEMLWQAINANDC